MAEPIPTHTSAAQILAQLKNKAKMLEEKIAVRIPQFCKSEPERLEELLGRAKAYLEEVRAEIEKATGV